MNGKSKVRIGVIGAALTGVCCFTPVLVIALGALGLTAWVGWLDVVLLPAMVFFLCLTAYGLWRLRSR